MADQVLAETAARLFDPPVGRELHEVGGLVAVEVVAVHEAELDRRRGDALLEVGGAEAEAEAEELDDEVLAR